MSTENPSRFLTIVSSPWRQLPAWFRWTLCGTLLLLVVGIRVVRYTQLEYQLRDSYGYIALAQKLAQKVPERIFLPDIAPNSLHTPPLLLAVLVAGEKSGLGAEKAGVAFVLLCGCLLPVVLALIAHELFGDWRYTAGTLLLAAVLPPLVRYSCVILRDMPYWLFCAAAVWLAVRAVRKESWLCWLGFAVLAALATCTRREGMELLLAWGLWLVLADWHKKGILRQFARKAGIAALVLIPYFVIALTVQDWWQGYGSSWQILPLQALGYYWERLI